MSSRLAVTPTQGGLGACISGVDLERPTDDDVEALHAALLAHEVLFFHDQDHLTPEGHVRLARRWGPVQRHPHFPHVPGFPEVVALDYDRANRAKVEQWHADMTFSATPPLGTILHARVLPERGGDTLFASMSAAWDALSDRWQRFLLGLEAVHDYAHGFRETLAEPGARERLAGALAANPPRVHPLVRRHPGSGKLGLFVNEVFTTHIVGMSRAESDTVLGFLLRHLQTPEFTCRFHWRVGSVAFWDNRITQHRPVNDYWPARRRMQRVTIDGDAPTGPSAARG